MGYYDIDDMLTEGSEIPCKFLQDIPGLGFLENNPGKPIKANAKLMLPYWLAHILAAIDNIPLSEDSMTVDDEEEPVPFLEMSTPESFSQRVINAIKTDPKSLDLHSINPHFYELAIKWCAIYSVKDLAKVVSELLLQRSQDINNFAYSMSTQTKNIDSIGTMSNITESKPNNLLASSSFLMTLDELEKYVYRTSHESYKNSKRWMYQNK